VPCVCPLRLCALDANPRPGTLVVSPALQLGHQPQQRVCKWAATVLPGMIFVPSHCALLTPSSLRASYALRSFTSLVSPSSAPPFAHSYSPLALPPPPHSLNASPTPTQITRSHDHTITRLLYDRSMQPPAATSATAGASSAL
jgi:hypothetical protein